MIRALLITAQLTLPVHDWYPLECCAQSHCRPVPCDQLVEGDNATLIYVPTKTTFARRQIWSSPDKHCHVCLNGVTPLCAFIQQGA